MSSAGSAAVDSTMPRTTAGVGILGVAAADEHVPGKDGNASTAFAKSTRPLLGQEFAGAIDLGLLRRHADTDRGWDVEASLRQTMWCRLQHPVQDAGRVGQQLRQLVGSNATTSSAKVLNFRDAGNVIAIQPELGGDRPCSCHLRD